MKYLVILVSVFFLASCASKSKKSGDKMGKDAPKKEMSKSDSKNTKKKAAGSTAGVDEPRTINCKWGDQAREIAVVRNDIGRCEVLYSRDGTSTKQGDGNGHSGFCDRVVEKIQGNLEGAGFTCQ